MKRIKTFLLCLLSVAGTLSLFACGDSGSGDSSKYDKELDADVREQIKQVAMSDELLTGNLENGTIKWLASWDINPDGTGKNVPIDLAVFQERYGGKVEYYQTSHEARYDKLAQYINSGEGIDFFSGGDKDAFPKGAIRGMFTTVDEYIDFDSPLWEDVKDINDSVMWNGNHYMTIVSVTGDNCAVIYNKNTIAEAGFEDPADLLEKDEWTWDAFQDMLTEFVDTDNQKYGIDGWWFESGLIQTTGVPAVGLEDGKLVNNLADPAMERVQNWMYELSTNGSIAIGVGDYGWSDKPEYIGEGKSLFYPVGLWKLYCSPEQWKEVFSEDVFFVPMPKDPDADEYYVPTGMDSYLFVKGGSNPEGVAKYLDCKRYVLLNDEVRKIADEQIVTDYGWTQEMIDMKNKMEEIALENPSFDFSNGVSSDLQDILDSKLRDSAKGVPWNETFDSIYATVQNFIDEVNENPIVDTAE